MYKRDGIKMADSAMASYKEQMNDFQVELQAIEKNKTSIEQELSDTLRQLTDGLLSSIETEKVQEIANECGALFLPNTLARLEKKRLSNEKRIAEIRQDDRYQRRKELLDSETGQYTLEIFKAQTELDVILEGLKPYELKQFKWLYKRGYHLDTEPNKFQSFIRAITLANKREERANTKCCAELKCHSFKDAAHDFDTLEAARKELEATIAQWEGYRKSLLAMIDEKGSLEDWNESFLENVLTELRGELFKHLQNCDYEQLQKQVRPAGKILMAKCHALKEKIRYADDMAQFLKKEIRDRQNRINSIGNVRNKWARKPYGPLRGDKRKWLQTVPAMKQASTRKRTRWIRTMNHNIYTYDNYGAYCCFMNMNNGFLAYDAFSYRQEERMPYEGFTSEVIGDISPYREEHDMEKADFSDFQEGLSDMEDYSENWEESEEDIAEAAAAALAAEEMIEASEDFELADES